MIVDPPFYLDWKFWNAVAACAALILSQLPPIRLWFKPKRIEVEVHSRIQINHWVGNPSINMFVSLRNTGGRPLRIKGVKLSVHRDGTTVAELGAQSFFETMTSQSQVLFVPFSLKVGDDWEHNTSFYKQFDGVTERLHRANASLVSEDITRKLKDRPDGNKEPVTVEEKLVAPFRALFDRLFVWQPGEYVVNLLVLPTSSSNSFRRSYRFTLYESDTEVLKKQTDEYKFGGGISYIASGHVGVFVPLSDNN